MPRNGTDLKPRILREARNVLLEGGYTALSTRRIARGVGCTAASIYLYFKNKDALLHALIDEGFEILHAQLEAVSHEGSPQDHLENLCAAYVSFANSNSEFYEVMFHLHPNQMERYPIDRYRVQRNYLALLGEAVMKSRQDSSPSPEATLRAATLVWSTLHGAVSLHLARRIDKSLRGSNHLNDAIRLAMRAVEISFPPSQPKVSS
ncbi:MAG TPA: TetR/AcrR family transcriptional regulator [Planctomycetes bacterium]|nr:TetR/AcrR family transcriptional regulator [Planctomycetota bacterium]HIL38696.1 TetR/AcrR family transcriptional regulator [Planctomycetota bacterium]